MAVKKKTKKVKTQKMEKAAAVLLKKPDIKNVDLAKKFGVPQPSAWVFRKSVEKYIAKHKLTPEAKEEVLAEVKAKAVKKTRVSRLSKLESLGAVIEMNKNEVVIRVPRKVFVQQLMSDIIG